MVGVCELLQIVQDNTAQGSGADRMPPAEQLDKISQTVRQMVDQQYQCFMGEVLPALEKEGIVVRGLKDLTPADQQHLRGVFSREIFPVLTPLAIDAGHRFPRLLN